MIVDIIPRHQIGDKIKSISGWLFTIVDVRLRAVENEMFNIEYLVETKDNERFWANDEELISL